MHDDGSRPDHRAHVSQEGMMSLALRSLVLAGFAVATPAAAQTHNAEIDCGGVFVPGDSVTWTAKFEEQGFFDHQIDVTVTVTPPGLRTKTLLTRTFTLFSNTDPSFTRKMKLPLAAPAGSYDMEVTADDGTLIVFDTCSFDVN